MYVEKLNKSAAVFSSSNGPPGRQSPFEIRATAGYFMHRGIFRRKKKQVIRGYATQHENRHFLLGGGEYFLDENHKEGRGDFFFFFNFKELGKNTAVATREESLFSSSFSYSSSRAYLPR